MSKKQQPIPRQQKPKTQKQASSAPRDLLSGLPREAAPMVQAQPGQLKKVLHVGCGQKRKDQMPKMFHGDDWQEIRLDIAPEAKPDIVADIMDMHPVAEGSVEAVFSSHNIEHVYIYQVQQVLKEFHRVVRVGGFALITCPDLQSIAFALAQGNLEGKLYDSPAGVITPLDIFYGHTASIARGEHYMAHKCGFTAETLGKRMQLAGFRDIVVERDTGFNLWARGTKVAANDPRMQDDKINLKGAYTQTVVNLPDVIKGKSADELDLPPKVWKPLGLQKVS